MKFILSFVFCLGIVFSSALAFNVESDSPPDQEKVEYSETLVINSEHFSDFEYTSVSNAMATDLESAVVFTISQFDEEFDIVFDVMDLKKYKLSNEKATTYLNNQGRDIFVSNIGYTLPSRAYYTNVSVNGLHLKYSGTETNQSLHTSGVSYSNKIVS